MREMEYKRKVDKKCIPTCNIMGVNIAAINMEWLVDYLEKNISEIKGDYVCVSNVHTTVTSFEDADYCAIQNGGLMAIQMAVLFLLLVRNAVIRIWSAQQVQV